MNPEHTNYWDYSVTGYSHLREQVPSGFRSVEDVFENAYCGTLALVVNEQTGWPIVGLRGRDGIENHYLVSTPDGRLLDVRGARTTEEVLQQWDEGNPGYYQLVDCTAEELWGLVERGYMEPPDPVRELADATAAAALATHSPQQQLDQEQRAAEALPVDDAPVTTMPTTSEQHSPAGSTSTAVVDPGCQDRIAVSIDQATNALNRIDAVSVANQRALSEQDRTDSAAHWRTDDLTADLSNREL